MKSISELVEEGYRLHLKIEALQNRLATIESSLKAEAMNRPKEHSPLRSKLSSGTQWIAAGNECEARVVLPSSRLKGSFPWEGKETERLRTVCGEHFERLFEPVWHFSPVHLFRQRATELLGSKASSLLRLCTGSSAPKILWKEKEVEAEV